MELELIIEFKNVYFDGDKRKMKKVVVVLFNFKVCEKFRFFICKNKI